MPQTVIDLTGRAWPGPALVLVRPDQYVAWTGDAAPGGPSALLDLVRGAV
jgi:4-hydroxyisophthalate hydroxylase